VVPVMVEEGLRASSEYSRLYMRLLASKRAASERLLEFSSIFESLRRVVNMWASGVDFPKVICGLRVSIPSSYERGSWDNGGRVFWENRGWWFIRVAKQKSDLCKMLVQIV
jgi:hypothetical protein